jgi:poly-beta-1,6-N-acetyl-D-glucosamine synthase
VASNHRDRRGVQRRGAIVATLERLATATYLGSLEVVLADNNSTDRTAELASGAARRLGMLYRRIFESVAGKHHALNTAVATVSTPLVLTVDADTFLHPDAIQILIARVTSRPQSQHICACAGALVAENATANFLTRMQSWDYRLGINGVKRTQGAYNSALVAQGAFSAYWTEDIRAVGGWPDAIGEDIVLTWTMMNSRGIVQYEPAALGFTVVPERLRGSHDPALTVGARSALGEHRSWALTTGGWDPGSISSLCPKQTFASR